MKFRPLKKKDMEQNHPTAGTQTNQIFGSYTPEI